MLDPERFRIADELFEKALDLPEDERAAWLDAHCDDPEIRAKVESLLAASGSTSGFVKPGGAMDGALGDALLGRAGPEKIEGYRLLRRIGEGGMGEVWEAEQQGAIERRVAIKLVKAGFVNEQVMARFDAERAAVARMNQPNIARVYDGGSTATGRPYFAMELVDGAPITDYCDREKLPRDERLRLFAQVCDGVQHAHQKGIIHRDIKPSNVLVATEDGKPVPKIIDFGVARAIERDADGVTEVGQAIGTPQYMSPEQTVVDPEEIDTRTDVYSLGVLLYELLVGVRPFELKESSASSLVELQRQIRETDPSQPSRHDRTLRGDLDWIVMRCLEKEPSRRYATPQELAGDVRRHLAGEPVLAGPPSVTYRWGKFVRRHRWASAAAAVAILALVAGTVVSTLQARRAIRAERAALEEAATAEQVASFLEELFLGADPVEALGRDPRASELLADGRERLAAELVDQPRIRARLLHTIGRIERKRGEFDEAESLLEEALALREAQFGRSRPETIQSLLELVHLANDRGEVQEAAEGARTALERIESDPDHDPLQRAEVLASLASTLTDLGDLDEAEPLQREAFEIRERALGAEHGATVNSLSTLGHLQYRRSDFTAAEATFRRVLELRTQLYGEIHPDVAQTQLNLAGVLARLGGDPGEQSTLLERALRSVKQVFGPDHLQVAAALRNLATFHSRQGRLAEGERLMREALAIYENKLEHDDSRVAGLCANLGLTHKLQGDFVEAEALFARSLRILESQAGPDDSRIPWTRYMLGSLTLDLERHDEAQRHFQQALEFAERVHGPDHPEAALPLRGLGGVALARDDLESAERFYRRSVEIVVTVHGEDFPNLGMQLRGLGETLLRGGSMAEARRHLDHALRIAESLSGPDHPGVVAPLHLLATLERSEGNLERAEALDRRALAIAEAAHGPEHLDVALALHGLAETALATGSAATAGDSARRALEIRSARLPAGHGLIRESAALVNRAKEIP